MPNLRVFLIVALSAMLALPIGSAIAAGPAPQSVLLKSAMLVNVNQAPQAPRGGKATPLRYYYANPSMVGLIKAALARGITPSKGKPGGGGGGSGGGGGGGSVTPTLPNLPGIALGSSFNALGMLDGGGYEPPDTILTAGVNGTSAATNVLEAVNLEAEVFSTSGTSLPGVSSFSLSAFTPDYLTDSVSDPRVLYDAATQRWFISLVTFSPISDAGWDLAVSATSDPTTGYWVLFYFPTAGVTNPDGSVGNFPDFPKIGFNGDKLVLTGDAFSVSQKGRFSASYKYQGTEFLVINKSELVTAANDIYANINNSSYQAPVVCTTFFPPNQGAVAIEPAENLPPNSTSSDTLYMAAVDSSVSSTKTLDIWTVTGNAASTSSTTCATSTAQASLAQVGINTISLPPNAQQEGTSTLIDTNDDSLLDAMFRPSTSDTSDTTGTLWVAANDACVPAGDSSTRSCARFIEVNIGSGGSMNVAQDFDLGSPGYYFYYPAVRTDSAGDLVTVFSGSSSTSFASVYAGMQKAGGSANELGYFQTVQLGNYQYTLSPPRWGDYSGASTDPTDSSIWIGGEYSTDYPLLGSIWGTWIASITPSAQ